MLFVIDAGNTNTVLGLFRGKDLVRHWRVETVAGRTMDEHLVLIRSLMDYAGLEGGGLSGAIISSVVPPLTPVLRDTMSAMGVEPIVVGPGIRTGMPILYDNPHEVGADRIVNAIAAFRKYSTALVVVDFGTATTFDAISEQGEYLGGAIAPGIRISASALFSRAAKLPRVELTIPEKVIGRTTESSIKSGIYFGYVSLVDGIVRRVREELEGEATVVATGGLASLVAKGSETITHVEPLLTLEGLRLIYEMNAER